MRVYLKAQVIREWLARQCQTHAWLAARVGITPTYLSHLLHGLRRPSPALRARLLQHTGLSFDDLFQIAASGRPPVVSLSGTDSSAVAGGPDSLASRLARQEGSCD